ncbi:LppY/LpqO family protein [Streptomyces litchfieldiae]|uniref:DUF1259 domain-containing protein n=1 Tax=Streptomyces litchfieldiae TaxID=3075543 RepID=A0ABU2MXZ5_9ACTN|nr:DUF1259 domain-containing protein [Streptomyces sp. DSM 44938]MDT0346381.1 DUF1259 domain-containing protein [Streptomyces sp. DSM 44938]
MSVTCEPERHPRAAATPRRSLMAAAVAAPVLAGATAGAARAASPGPVQPVPTVLDDWTDVGSALGRRGNMNRGLIYRASFPRLDLRVVCQRVTVTPELALGSHVGFIRYADGSTMMMGDLTVTEREMAGVLAPLHEHGVETTAIHKHLPAHSTDVWWIHAHAHGHDPVPLARAVRAAIDATGTPPPGTPPPEQPLDLDTAGLDAALGARGTVYGDVYKFVLVRREQIVRAGLALPPGLGSTTALNFQPVGSGRAAFAGDFVMVADEVLEVLTLLGRGGIRIVTLHNHDLREDPRLFFVHLWAVDDAVRIGRALRPALDVTNVEPVG